MNVNLKLLGKNLHRLRVAAQMSQEELRRATLWNLKYMVQKRNFLII